MPQLPPIFRPGGSRTRREVNREADARRGSAASRGYDSRWAKASAAHRRRNPLCVYCELEDRVTAATLTDHLYPHRVFEGVFWRTEWWCSCCDDCHNGMKQRAERAGKAALDALALALGRPVLTPAGRGRGVQNWGPPP